MEVPASAVPCAGCHGRDGKGKPEGGVTPSDLTWTALTRPYGVTHPGGRKHPPYDARLLKRAVSMGPLVIFGKSKRSVQRGPSYRLKLVDGCVNAFCLNLSKDSLEEGCPACYIGAPL